MAEVERYLRQHPAAAWGDLLMGQSVQDRWGRHLGIVEAVATTSGGRLRRIGVRANPHEDRIRFFSAEGAELHREHIVLRLDTRRLDRVAWPVETQRHGRFRLFFDPRRRSLFRTR